MTPAQVKEHQRRHGFLQDDTMPAKTLERAYDKLLKINDRMNKTEREYGLILEAMKGRGEIVEYRFEGISLSWGADPRDGKLMWYTPDFLVVIATGWKPLDPESYTSDKSPRLDYTAFKLIEIKGPHIFAKDKIRFKGCRAEWPMFQFEMHQRERGGHWRRIH
jgi:hypothetical protein